MYQAHHIKYNVNANRKHLRARADVPCPWNKVLLSKLKSDYSTSLSSSLLPLSKQRTASELAEAFRIAFCVWQAHCQTDVDDHRPTPLGLVTGQFLTSPPGVINDQQVELKRWYHRNNPDSVPCAGAPPLTFGSLSDIYVSYSLWCGSDRTNVGSAHVKYNTVQAECKTYY